jgi:excisionase family DNA binding protein
VKHIPEEEKSVENDSQILLVSRRQVAAMLGVSQRTVIRLTQQGVLPTPLRVGRGVRWPETQILDAIRRLSQVPAAQP